MKKSVFLLIIMMGIAYYCNAQSYTVNNLISAVTQYRENHTPDKLYLQINKTNYALDDTLWFKAYLLDASLRPSTKSNIVYVEISNENNVLYKRCMLIMEDGLGNGCIPLSKANFPEGGYTLRAYTNWMRNFDESLMYKKDFYISDINRDKWMMSFNTLVVNDKTQLTLRLTNTNKQPVTNQEVLIGVTQGERVLRRQKPQITNQQGEVGLGIAITNKEEPVYLSLYKGSYSNDYMVPYKFPIIYNRPEKTDVQFMPEGGYLVTGIPSAIAFKAVAENGEGIDLSGSIIDAANKLITTFKTTHAGIGRFDFLPKEGMQYKALITLPGGLKKEYPFPAVKPAGTVLSVINPSQGDSVIIKIAASDGLAGQYLLTGQSRGLICFGARLTLSGNTQIIKAPKNAFATGIVRFTLLNEQLKTLNERIIYVNNHDNLQIKVLPDRDIYAPQDSIALNVEVKDIEGKPVQGNFSMSVINDLQLTNNKTSNSNINTNLLLTSDLKGDIEDPAYYFTDNRETELDNLLLTQGWTAFDWQNLFKPQTKLQFVAQPKVFISGKVTNLFNKGVNGATVSLLSLKPYYRDTTKTDASGHFILENIPQTDSAFFLRARNSKDKRSTYALDVDWPTWPVFVNRLQMPWYVNTDTVTLKVADSLLHRELETDSLNYEGTLLHEVKIKAKKVVKGSYNLNGPGSADRTIDEADIAKLGKMSLIDLLQKTVPGFRYVPKRGSFIYSQPVIIIVNGGKGAGGKRITDLTSNDIIGIEVTLYNTITYLSELDLYPDKNNDAAWFPPLFIDITTRSKGEGLNNTQALTNVIYRPIPKVLNQQFYRPVYKIKNLDADKRTTIHWEPNIITNKDGKATVTFYAAGQPATYTIITEGSNMNGNVGSITQNLIIK